MPRALITTGHVYFSVDQPVGRDAPNDRFDVLLVQFLLRIATSGYVSWPTQTQSFFVGSRVATPAPGALPGTMTVLPTGPGGVEIAIDGDCGPQTIQFIEFFQQQMLIRGQPHVTVDGQVRPWARNLSLGDTIVLLNWALSRSRSGPARKWTLYNDPAFPRDLFYYLFTSSAPFP